MKDFDRINFQRNVVTSKGERLFVGRRFFNKGETMGEGRIGINKNTLRRYI
jgi:hypothetical protein